MVSDRLREGKSRTEQDRLPAEILLHAASTYSASHVSEHGLVSHSRI